MLFLPFQNLNFTNKELNKFFTELFVRFKEHKIKAYMISAFEEFKA